MDFSLLSSIFAFDFILMNFTTTIDTKISLKTWASDLKQLMKVGLSLSVVFSSVAGYLLAVKTIHYPTLLLLSLGGFLMVAASNAFNQIIEKTTDALMQRTMNRPLPAGRMSIAFALVLAVIFTLGGITILYNINPKRAPVWSHLHFSIYLCVHPMKSITPLAVFVGAFPGAIPFMLGWVAATGHFGYRSWISLYDSVFLAVPTLLGYWMVTI